MIFQTVERLGQVELKNGAVKLLSLVTLGDEPPSEFRIFTAGKVDTSKGEFLFDDDASDRTLAEYKAQGNELMIDYDHASLSPLVLDPAQAGKAAGWFSLELRDGELWAVNVRWTQPALEALRRKEWRYMSPAFTTEENRITSLINVALTNIPATRELQPLVAASKKETFMTAEQLAQLAQIYGLDADATADDILSAAKASNGRTPTETPTDAGVQAAMAATSRIVGLTEKGAVGEAIDEIERWRRSHVELTSERAKIATERSQMESSERQALGVQLVRLGTALMNRGVPTKIVSALGLTPGTVWADAKAQKLAEPWASMPVAMLRAKVSSLQSDQIRGANGVEASSARGAGEWGLTEREISKLKARGLDPEKYAKTKASMLQGKAANGEV